MYDPEGIDGSFVDPLRTETVLSYKINTTPYDTTSLFVTFYTSLPHICGIDHFRSRRQRRKRLWIPPSAVVHTPTVYYIPWFFVLVYQRSSKCRCNHTLRVHMRSLTCSKLRTLNHNLILISGVKNIENIRSLSATFGRR